MSVEDKLKEIQSFSSELGLDLKKPEDRFKWFLASLFFAKRISAEIAKKTFKLFIEEGLTTPKALLDAGWDRLVEVLDAGGYVRYDFSTASTMLENAEKLLKEYGGDIDLLHDRATNSEDLERRLMEFKGFGPTAVNIFLRELREIWSKARPKLSEHALKVAGKLSLDVKQAEQYEPQLVKLYIEYCKKSRCSICPVKNFCSSSTRVA